MKLDHRFFDEHQYALINPLQIDRRIARLWPCSSVVPAELQGQQHIFPYLIDFREMSADERFRALDETVDYAQCHDKSPFSALIVSGEKQARLKGHLSRAMVMPVEGEKMLFRYFDPRVWACLLWILREAQLSSLLGPIQRWTAPSDKDGNWAPYFSRGQTREALLFDAEQVRAIASLASVNRVVARLNSDAEQTAFDEGLSRIIYREMERARSLGLTDSDDLEAFAYVSVTETPEVHKHSAFREAINIAKVDPGAYRSIVTNLVERLRLQSLDIRENNGAI